jgi:hypothetical protein
MPNDISYPYRGPVIALLFAAFAIFITTILLLVLISSPTLPSGVKISALIIVGPPTALLAYALVSVTMTTYICWKHQSVITLRQSDIVLPLGLTKPETAIRYDDIVDVEKAYGNRGSVSLKITPRGGADIKISENWLPRGALAKLQEELQTRQQMSKHDSDG